MATDVLAAHDVARELIGATQATGSGCNVALAEQTAHQRRTDGYARLDEGLRLHHLDAQFAAMAHVVGKAFLAIVAEAVVVAYEQEAHAQLLQQHLLHELAGRERCQLAIEREHFDAPDGCLLQQLQLFFGRGEQLGLPVGADDLARMIGKGDDERAQSALTGHPAQLADEVLMTAMHAIEKADGGCRRQRRGME